jgi:hypothetical protein
VKIEVGNEDTVLPLEVLNSLSPAISNLYYVFYSAEFARRKQFLLVEPHKKVGVSQYDVDKVLAVGPYYLLHIRGAILLMNSQIHHRDYQALLSSRRMELLQLETRLRNVLQKSTKKSNVGDYSYVFFQVMPAL